MNPSVLKNLQAAITFLGQAQEETPVKSDLWSELGDLYSKLEDIEDAVKNGQYDETGEFCG